MEENMHQALYPPQALRKRRQHCIVFLQRNRDWLLHCVPVKPGLGSTENNCLGWGLCPILCKKSGSLRGSIVQLGLRIGFFYLIFSIIIDVKLQDVLGHFQKEFEGGVSAENLAYFSYYSSSSFKKMDHSSTSEVHVSATMAPQPFPGVPMDTDAGLLPQGACLVPQVPDVMKENWIMCDECEKWRLLPYRMDSSKPLPKKWFCRMLDWLPNMNRCDIGEDETTQALYAIYGIQPGQGQMEANKEQLPLPGAPQGVCLVPQRPVVIKENWIMCDECEKWRLLPYGMDSSKPLPKKWFCWMLDWLPNMNRCDIGEDETTQAVNAMYGIQPG